MPPSPTFRLLELGGTIHLALVDPDRPRRVLRFVPLRARRLDLVPLAGPRQANLRRKVLAAREAGRLWQ